MKKARILIVDDHVMIRLGLVEAINGEADFIRKEMQVDWTRQPAEI